MESNVNRYIWKSFVEGDSKAFADLYDLYAEDLFRYGMTISKDESIVPDLIQELFIEIWNKRTKLSNIEYPKTYLLKALYYKLLRHSKQPTQPINDLIYLHEENSAEVSWILKETQQEQMVELQKHLKALPERQRLVLHLKYFQNLSSKQIGEILDINTQSGSNLLYRGLNSLRKNILKKN